MSKIEDNYLFVETWLKSWEDIFQLDQRFLNRFIFRGQSDINWVLSTSLERQINRLQPNLLDKDTIPFQEKEMIKEFQWKYPLYSSNGPEKEDLIEWLAIMQHYGSATRLLDFTNSIFVAIYMALYDNANDSSVWALNTIPLNHKVFARYRKIHNVNSISYQQREEFSLELANEFLHNKKMNLNFEKELLVLKPKNTNERLSRQQGLFVMPTNVKCEFKECLQTYLSSNDKIEIDFKELIKYSKFAKFRQEDISIIKINIPKSLNYQIQKYLREMNVTSEILFPGLEGLAKSVNYMRFNL